MRRAAFACVVACLLGAATPALAQRGRPIVPPGQAKKGQQAPATSSGLVTAESGGTIEVGSARVRALGAWLDDATLLAPGETWVALSASRWSLPIASGADAPVVDVSAGITPRIQAAVSLPYFRAAAAGGGSIHGIGDVYVTTKVLVREPSDEGVGISVSPTLELLSRASMADATLRRANWLLPLNLERRLTSGRIYGSTGWFSRGAFFVSTAAERYFTDAFAVSAGVTYSHATDADALSEELGLGRRRADVMGTAAYSISPALAVYGSLARTVWGRDVDSTRLLASGGVSVKVH